MIGYWQGKQYVEAPADDSLAIEQYKMHVANGTVPKKGIPYTKIRKPVSQIPAAIYAINQKAYIREFERLNLLKEIPQ